MTNFNCVSEKIIEEMENKFSDNFDNIKYYFTALALCHSINVEKDKKNIIKYHSSSPDETALINCARYYQYIYHKKDKNIFIHLILVLYLFFNRHDSRYLFQI